MYPNFRLFISTDNTSPSFIWKVCNKLLFLISDAFYLRMIYLIKNYNM